MPLTNVQARDVEAVVHPYTPLNRLREIGPLVLERGRGVFVYDTQGREYIEGMAGLWCAGLGFGDEELAEAGAEQLRKLPYYHLFGAKGMEPAIELAEKLKELAPIDVARVFFCSSGSEANDTQVKLAWYYNNALGRPNKKKIISRVKAYHGVTVMTASLTDCPTTTSISTCRSTACCTPTARTTIASPSRARPRRSSPPASPPTFAPSSSARGRRRSPPSSPSR